MLVTSHYFSLIHTLYFLLLISGTLCRKEAALSYESRIKAYQI